MYFFAYGIAVAGRTENALLIRGMQVISETASVKGILFDTGLGFPAMTSGESVVTGSLFLLDEETLPTLYEFAKRFNELNPPYEFVLTPVTVTTAKGNFEARCFMYESNDGLEAIPSGIWR